MQRRRISISDSNTELRQARDASQIASLLSRAVSQSLIGHAGADGLALVSEMQQPLDRARDLRHASYCWRERPVQQITYVYRSGTADLRER